MHIAKPSKLSLEDAFALACAAALTAVCVSSGWFDYVCMTLRHGEQYELDEYAGAAFVFLAAAVVLFARREWQLRTCLRQAAVREKAAHDAARRDYLTNLPNRLALMEGLEGAREPSVSLLLIDLDGFKSINDRYGHAAGDAVLRTVAERLQRICNDAGGLVARLGGDEFGYLLPQSSERIMAMIKGRITRYIREPIALPTGEVTIDASVGNAASTDASSDPDSLLQDADAAMYREKQQRQLDRSPDPAEAPSICSPFGSPAPSVVHQPMLGGHTSS
ncbi:GGDEF domain-containing protein [Sphingomonas sp. TZW2008]|uniref:GGDEF domain-containing protein n=1 Tax=Sphingomonas sp. TZW2008 TaxID=1917973 RepID=UPI001C4E5275|nr:GGDEF domain-containing protein [Sphingomonas sp. TZW2008]